MIEVKMSKTLIKVIFQRKISLHGISASFINAEIFIKYNIFIAIPMLTIDGSLGISPVKKCKTSDKHDVLDVPSDVIQ